MACLIFPTSFRTFKKTEECGMISRVSQTNFAEICDSGPNIAISPTIFTGRHVK